MGLVLTKSFDFIISHRLEGHKGLCNNVHGHNYKLYVSVSRRDGGTIKDDKSSNGMVIDFKDLKDVVNEVVIKRFDHAFVYNINDKDSIDIAEFLQKKINQKVLPLSIRTTAENMVEWIIGNLDTYFLEHELNIYCVNIKLYETDTSYAEFGIKK